MEELSEYTMISERSTIFSPAFDITKMSSSTLASYCRQELSKYHQGVACDEQYALELLHRVTIQHDLVAWLFLQGCLQESMYDWMQHYSKREIASRFDGHENYVARAFAKFWDMFVCQRQAEFVTLKATLQALYVCLNAVILDTLRRESSLAVLQANSTVYKEDDSNQLWEIVQEMLPNARAQRLAYLLFHCGLRPEEIVQSCHCEFNDVEEVRRLRNTILVRLSSNPIFCG